MFINKVKVFFNNINNIIKVKLNYCKDKYVFIVYFAIKNSTPNHKMTMIKYCQTAIKGAK